MTEREQTLEEAAQLADLFAEEVIKSAGDAVLSDLRLVGQEGSMENVADAIRKLK